MEKYDCTKLKKNIIDMVTEQQLKLGYMKETVRLYYLDRPLKRILGTDAEDISDILKDFCEIMDSEIGHMDIIREEGRYCFLLSPEVSEYVHDHMHEQPFLKELVETVGSHGASMDRVLDVFRKYSDHVHIEPKEGEDFDILAYFEDGKPDDMRYCLTDEGCHVIYHRYMKEDYEDIFGAPER